MTTSCCSLRRLAMPFLFAIAATIGASLASPPERFRPGRRELLRTARRASRRPLLPPRKTLGMRSTELPSNRLH